MTVKEKIDALRLEMRKSEVDVYIIPSTDPHSGEYIPKRWQSRQWISGFTGSAGTVVVTHDMAGLWTDSRYFIQAENELLGSGMVLIKMKIPHFPCYMDWISENLEENSHVGLDGTVFSVSDYDRLEGLLSGKNMKINTNLDLINNIWLDRPGIPKNKIFIHEEKYSGKSVTEKLKLVRGKMSDSDIDFHLITTLDDIAWLFNIRGDDIEFNPVAVSYALVDKNKATLFIEADKIETNTRKKLSEHGVMIMDYNDISKYLSELPEAAVIMFSPGKTNIWLYKSIPVHCTVNEVLAITTRLKAIKNPIEIQHFRNVLIKDGVALEKFFFWLEKNLGKEKITELSAAEKLSWFRSNQELFIGSSFYPISGYKGNGAMAHYHVLPETDQELKSTGLFLLDSGGQYLDGTTDTTRTTAMGLPTAEEKTYFTLALKGMIQLSNIKFPSGTFGHQIDAFARKAMWDRGMNYGHGTGHGVGFFLNVHEGPQGIGPRPGDPKAYLEKNMVITNEPALYKEGGFGVRTENLMLVIDDIKTEFGDFLKFETLTFCHIDTNLIDLEIMDKDEIDWINEYHEKVFEKLGQFLDKQEKQWLKEKTRKI